MFTGKVHDNNFRNFLVYSVYWISWEEICFCPYIMNVSIVFINIPLNM